MPPRPTLAQSVAQRAALADALIRERERARHANSVVRYRAGLSEVPPGPMPPPPPAAAPAAPPGPTPPAAEVAAPLEEPTAMTDDGGLDSFIRGLVRDAETVAPPSSSSAAPGDDPPEPGWDGGVGEPSGAIGDAEEGAPAGVGGGAGEAAG